MTTAPEASSSASPITQVSQDDNRIPDALAASIITQVSPNSPNPGARPQRPVKAQRAPKLKRKEGDSVDAATGAPLAAGEQVSDDEDDVDAVDGDRTGAEASEGTQAASVTQSVNTPGPAGASGPDSLARDSPAPSATTADQSSTIKTTETPSTKPAPVAAAAPTTTAPRSSANNNATKPRSVKKKGGLGSFFACLPCFGSSAHDDRPTPRPATTSAPTSNPPAATNEKAEPTLNEKVQDSATSTSKTAVAAGPTDLSTAEKDLSVAPVTAAPSPSGVELPRDETEGVTSGAVMAPGKDITGAPGKTRRRRSGKQPESIITSVPEPGAVQESSEEGSDESDEEDEEDEEQSLIARGGVGIPIGEDGLPHPLLDELAPELKGRKCLVLDLDETLVHSSFKMVHQADYVVPVEIENQYHNVYVIKRPGVDGFLKAMGEIYEVVIFTASLSKYADPVLDQLDIHRVVKHRLFRESCYNNKGNYVKDLSQLGRPMSECIIIDNSPASYVFHVNNAVPISSWFNDPHDTELTDLVPFLTDLERVDDVRSVLDAGLYQQMSFV